MTWTKRAGWVFLFVFVAFGCSGDGGSGSNDESTGTNAAAISTFCGTPGATLTASVPTAGGNYNVATTTSTLPPIGWYIPDEVNVTSGTPNGQITLTYYAAGVPPYVPSYTCYEYYTSDPPRGFKYTGGSGGSGCPSTAGTFNPGGIYVTVTLTLFNSGSVAVQLNLGNGAQNAILDDGNKCTVDACHADGTATHTSMPAGASCSDGIICNGAEVCSGSPSNPTCASPGNAPVGTSCDDGNLCNGLETCNGSGSCNQPETAFSSTTSTDGCTKTQCSTTLGIQVVPTGACTASPPSGVTGSADPTVPTTVADSTSFLYSGSSPSQEMPDGGGLIVPPNPIEAAVVRGQVFNTSGADLQGVTVSILNHPEFGQTTSRADGWFDLAVNGGGPLTVVYMLAGYLTVHRQAATRWGRFAIVDDVVMTPKHVCPQSPTDGCLEAPISTTDTTTYQYMRGSQTTLAQDSDGARQAVVIFPPGTHSVTPGFSPSQLTVHATEFTIGKLGPKAMPAALPADSGYTYAVELSVDEADLASVPSVAFNQSVYFYLDNFLALAKGTNVPNGYYDRTAGKWVASANGDVISLTVSGTTVTYDDGGAGLSIPSGELQQLGAIYGNVTNKTLWRIPMTHFSTYDGNFGVFPPADAALPPSTPPNPSGPLPDPCEVTGSIIECQNQSLGETIPLAGTPYFLRYASRKAPGASARVSIPVSGATVPASLKRVDVEIIVAGHEYNFSLPSVTPNQTVVWNWDGVDAYGRPVQGSQNADIRVTYVYQGVTGNTAKFGALPASQNISGNRATREIFYYRDFYVPIGGVNANALGFGGWTLSPQHLLDFGRNMVERGDGARIPNAGAGTVSTVAGGGPTVFWTDGAIATGVQLSWPQAVAADKEGNTYFTDGNWLYEVTTTQQIYHIAGTSTHTTGVIVENQSAVGADIHAFGIAVDRDDSIVVVDQGGYRIVRISAPPVSGVPTGRTVNVIAGSDTPTMGYVDGVAASARFGNPTSVAIAPDETIYVTDTTTVGATPPSAPVIRRITTDGYVDTIAGDYTCSPTTKCDYTTDGTSPPRLASVSMLGGLWGIAVAPNGTIYFTQYPYLVRSITPDGYIHRVAGTGSQGYMGEGGPAISSTLLSPNGVAVDSFGNVFIADDGNCLVREVTTDGIIHKFIGFQPPAQAGGTIIPRTCGTDPDGYLPGATIANQPWTVGIGPDNALYYGTANDPRIRRVLTPSSIVVPSGDEAYVFDSNGRHTETRSAVSGNGVLALCYDNTTGLLSKLVDEACAGSSGFFTDGGVAGFNCSTTYSGCETTITRTSNSVTIQPRFGLATTLGLDSTTNLLTAVTDPNGAQYQMAYTNGLLTSFADPRNVANGLHHSLQYTTDGLLISDADPIASAAGAATKLSRTWTPQGWTTSLVSSAGRSSVYGTDHTPTTSAPLQTELRTVQRPDGTQAIESRGTDDSRTLTLADGTVIKTSFAPDPRFGWSGKYVAYQSTSTGTHTATSAFSREESRTTSPAFPVMPFGPSGPSSETDQIEFNPATVGTYDTNRFFKRSTTFGSNPVVTMTTPVGLCLTKYFDALGRVTKIQIPNLADTILSYDPVTGKLSDITQSGRDHHNYYYTSGTAIGLLQNISDTIEGSTVFNTYDSDGRIEQTTLPGLRVTVNGYDSNGNLSGVQVPNVSVQTHAFQYNANNFLTNYLPPVPFPSFTPTNTSYVPDLDGLLVSVATPDGYRQSCARCSLSSSTTQLAGSCLGRAPPQRCSVMSIRGS